MLVLRVDLTEPLLFFSSLLMLWPHALPALFDLHRGAVMADAAGLVMDNAKDSGVIVCI